MIHRPVQLTCTHICTISWKTTMVIIEATNTKRIDNKNSRFLGIGPFGTLIFLKHYKHVMTIPHTTLCVRWAKKDKMKNNRRIVYKTLHRKAMTEREDSHQKHWANSSTLVPAPLVAPMVFKESGTFQTRDPLLYHLGTCWACCRLSSGNLHQDLIFNIA